MSFRDFTCEGSPAPANTRNSEFNGVAVDFGLYQGWHNRFAHGFLEQNHMLTGKEDEDFDPIEIAAILVVFQAAEGAGDLDLWLLSEYQRTNHKTK